MKMIAIICLLLAGLPPYATLEDALQKAQQEDKQVLLYFSGSDWCLPCIRFKKMVLQDATFQAATEATLLVYQVDFPRRDKADQAAKAYKRTLAERYNPKGTFPKMLLLDANGQVLWEQEGYQNQKAEVFLKNIPLTALPQKL